MDLEEADFDKTNAERQWSQQFSLSEFADLHMCHSRSLAVAIRNEIQPVKTVSETRQT